MFEKIEASLRKIVSINRLLEFVFAVFALVIYLPNLFRDFLFNSDDSWMLVNNEQVWGRGYSLEFLLELFTTFRLGQYSPLNTLYYKIIFDIFSLNPTVYYLFSILIHYLNSLLVIRTLLLIKQFESVCIRRIEFEPRIEYLLGFIFLIHPLNVEVVSWIACSKILLCTTFLLISIQIFIRFIITGRFSFYIFSFLSGILAFGFKEQAIIISVLLTPFVMHSKLGKRYKFLVLLPFFVFSALGIWWTLIGINETFTYKNELFSLSNFVKRIPVSISIFIRYLINLVFAYPLYIKYTLSDQLLSIVLTYYIPFVILILFVSIVIVNAMSVRFIFGYGIIFFLANMIMYLNLITIPRFSIMADRYMYMTMIGFFISIVSFIDFGKKSRLIIAIYCFYHLFLSVNRNISWVSYFNY